MTLDGFRQSLTAAKPRAELTHALAGLWWDAKGDWTRAHESAQQDEGVEGSWVHAYLHRKEGDQGNAAYWYGRAGKPVCPGATRCGMARHRGRLAGINRPPAFRDCESLCVRLRIVLGKNSHEHEKFGEPFRR
jgi:hypothetical protein